MQRFFEKQKHQSSIKPTHATTISQTRIFKTEDGTLASNCKLVRPGTVSLSEESVSSHAAQMCQTRHTRPNLAQIRPPLPDTLERKSSYPSTPVSDKGIGHTYNEEKQTRGHNAEAERSIIGCETVKIRARTPFGFNDSRHIGINWRIIRVNETAQKISLPDERSRNPLRFQGNTMRKQT